MALIGYEMQCPTQLGVALEKKRVKGVEPDVNPENCSENLHISGAGAAEASAAVCPPLPADTDLRELSEHWPFLPIEVRVGVMALIRAASKYRDGDIAT